MLQPYLNLTIRLFSVMSRTLVGEGSYPLAEKLSVYSIAPTDWAMGIICIKNSYYNCLLRIIISYLKPHNCKQMIIII